TQRSTSEREPTNFASMTIDLGKPAGRSTDAGARTASARVPHRKSTTRSGDSSQPGGRGATSTARRNASCSAKRSSAGGCWTDNDMAGEEFVGWRAAVSFVFFLAMVQIQSTRRRKIIIASGVL